VARNVAAPLVWVALWATGTSFGQQPGGQAAQFRLELRKLNEQVEELRGEVRKLKQGPAQKDPVEAQKLQAEATKLREETKWLPLQALGLGTIIGTIVGGLLVWYAGSKLQDIQSDKLVQDLELSRREHDLQTFEALGGKDPRIRIGAVSVLAQRVLELNAKSPLSPIEKEQRRTIIRVLVAVTKYEKTEEIQKYIADRLKEVLEAEVTPQTPLSGDRSPMADFDLQGARLTNAWWKNVDLRSVDLYGATLERAGMAGSYLGKTVLKKANLKNATLWNPGAGPAHAEEVNLEHANLTNARCQNLCFKDAKLSWADFGGADLTGADFRGATLDRTVLRNATMADVNLEGVDLSTADLQGAILTRAKSNGGTKLPAGTVIT